ncbi:MAG: D-tyrosyl-tRNA(Tyr) deacylase [Deltaproteobacteria bacterium]|nr:D-tyrosyl-tRNA(Tyr) deacylase [Deltaproteobacteria bacterium]
MRAVVQRVSSAAVSVEGEVVGSIGAGLMILLGVGPADGPAQVEWLAQKLVGLRIFSDEAGKMNRSLLDEGGGALVVSQFTLFGDTRRGRRPSFVGAAGPELAVPLYQAFLDALRAQGVARVEAGLFGAHMEVALVNDGPVTLIVETP